MVCKIFSENKSIKIYLINSWIFYFLYANFIWCANIHLEVSLDYKNTEKFKHKKSKKTLILRYIIKLSVSELQNYQLWKK